MPTAYRPRDPFTAPTRWINDPNGVCFHQGRHHLYHPYNPPGCPWGNIHRGHASSVDLVHGVYPDSGRVT